DAQARSDRVRVVVGERAVTSGFVNLAARMAARGRIRHERAEVAEAPVMLPGVGTQIPAYAVVESQLARDFPRILRKQGPLFLGRTRHQWTRQRRTAQLSQEEAGELEP